MRLRNNPSQSEEYLICHYRCGEWDINSEDELFPFQERELEEITVHPDFNPVNFKNDIAILKVKSYVL